MSVPRARPNEIEAALAKVSEAQRRLQKIQHDLLEVTAELEMAHRWLMDIHPGNPLGPDRLRDAIPNL